MPFLFLFTCIAIIGGGAYWYVSSKSVFIEKSTIVAPIIQLAPVTPGKLQEIYVSENDNVLENTPIARVGNEILKAKTSGIILMVNNNIGALFDSAHPVVTMLHSDELRVIGQIEEDKGLSDIHVGQRAIFTVDAFGSKQFGGIVDEVSPTSRESDVVFNISDKRQVKEFNVKIRFDVAQYPEIKNGMSAKLWIYK